VEGFGGWGLAMAHCGRDTVSFFGDFWDLVDALRVLDYQGIVEVVKADVSEDKESGVSGRKIRSY